MRNYSRAAIPSDALLLTTAVGNLNLVKTLHRHRCAVHDLLDDLFGLLGFLQGR